MAISGRQMLIDVQSRYSGNGFDMAAGRAKALQQSLSLFASGMVIKRVGQFMEDTGKRVVGFMEQGIKANMQFVQDMRLANTQAHLNERGFNQLSDSVRRIARDGVRPIKELTAATYDLFSSIDIGGDKVKTAAALLELFDRAAAAGGTDAQTVARGVIAMNNAYGRVGNVKNFNETLDIQFRMVEKGVGTYQEFASSLGQVLPSSRRFGQSLNDMAGSLAFATRQGMNTSLASISVARAFDLLGRPKTIQGVKKAFDVNIVDPATHKYREIGDIITDLAKKMDGLTAPQRTAALSLALGGGKKMGTGDIRALRFLTQATSNVKAYVSMLKDLDTENSKGAMARAFKEMEKSPMFQLSVLTNKWHDALIEVGRVLGPTVAQGLAKINHLLTEWENLPEKTRHNIIMFIAAGGAILTIGGALLTVIGSIRTFRSLLKLSEAAATSFGVAGEGGIMSMLGPTTLLIAALVYLFRHLNQAGAAGDRLRKVGQQMFAALAKAGQAIIEALQPLIPILLKLAVAVLIPLIKAVTWLANALTHVKPLITIVAGALIGMFIVSKLIGIITLISNAFLGAALAMEGIPVIGEAASGALVSVGAAGETAAVGLSSMLGPLAILAADAAGVAVILGKVKDANHQTSNSFLTDLVPTLLKTGRTLQITAAQWRSGPFGGSDINKVKAVFADLKAGTINYGQAFQRLQQIAGVTWQQIRQVAWQSAQAAIKSKNWAQFANIVTTAIQYNIASAAQFANMLVTAGLKGKALAAALASIPPLIRSQVEIDVWTIQHAMSTSVKNDINSRQAARGLPPIYGTGKNGPTAAQIHANVVARQQAQLTNQINAANNALLKQLPGSVGGSAGGGGGGGGGGRPKKPVEPQWLKDLRSEGVAMHKWIGIVIQRVRALNTQHMTSAQVAYNYTKILAGADTKTAALAASVKDAVDHKLLPKSFLSRAQTLARTASTLEAKWAALNDQMKSFSDAIGSLFGNIGQLSDLAQIPGLTGAGVNKFFTESVTQAQQVQQVLMSLQKAGLRKDLLQQLAGLTPQQVISVGGALLQSNIPLVNKSVATIAQIAKTTTTNLVDKVFGPAVKSLTRQTNAFIYALNKLINAINARIPHRQAGAILKQPSMMVAGDVPEGEAVIPLNRRGVEFTALAFERALGTRGGMVRSSRGDVHLHIEGPIDWSPKRLVEEVEWSRRTSGW